MDNSLNEIEPLADDVVIAAKRIGIGRAKMYEEIREGQIDSFKVGSRRKVSREAQRRFIRKREAEERAAREAETAREADDHQPRANTSSDENIGNASDHPRPLRTRPARSRS